MATNVTYTSLFADVVNYLERGGSVASDETARAQIPRAINQAERRIMNALDLLGERTVLIDREGFVAGVSVIPKPDRWRVTAGIWYGGGASSNARRALFPRSYDWCRAYWPDDSVQGTPEFYADYDLGNWLIAPTPDATYPVELIAYMQPQLLDASNQENFLTIYCGPLLLYTTLLEMTPFLKNDERIPLWQRYADIELGNLNGQDLRRIMDNTTERTRP
jgi:hypothetical protein